MVHNVNFAAEGNQLNFKFVRPYLVSIGGGTFSGKGGGAPRVWDESIKFSRQQLFSIVDPPYMNLF